MTSRVYLPGRSFFEFCKPHRLLKIISCSPENLHQASRQSFKENLTGCPSLNVLMGMFIVAGNAEGKTRRITRSLTRVFSKQVIFFLCLAEEKNFRVLKTISFNLKLSNKSLAQKKSKGSQGNNLVQCKNTINAQEQPQS